MTAEYAECGVHPSQKTWCCGFTDLYSDGVFGIHVTGYYDMTEFILINISENWFQIAQTPDVPAAESPGDSPRRRFCFRSAIQHRGWLQLPLPADLSSDSALYNWGDFLGNFVDGFNNTDSAFVSHILKYRFRHMLRFDCQADPGRMMFGLVVNYYSYMENIDYVFEKFGIPGRIV